MAEKDPYKYYRIEANELLEQLTRAVMALDRSGSGGDGEAVGRVLRIAHTLKGAARVVRQTATSEVAHRIEDHLGPYRDGGDVPPTIGDALLQLVDLIRAQVQALSAPPAPGGAGGSVGGSVGGSAGGSAGGSTVGDGAGSAAKAGTATGDTQSGKAAASAPAATDSAPAATPATTTSATTGATTSVALDELGRERFEQVRVAVSDMDGLLHGVAEIALQLGALRAPASELRRAAPLLAQLTDQLARHAGGELDLASNNTLDALRALLQHCQQSLAAGLDRGEAELRRLEERANALRLLPASAIFATLERAVRDVARMLGKNIVLQTHGGDQRLDGHVLGPLSEALLHLVRNAADHGIESADERRAAGKAPSGCISLSFSRRGDRIVCRCQDDGRGLQIEAIRMAALRSGRLRAEQAAAFDLAAATQLLVRGGISTKSEVTEISGRGIGLDAVRAVAARLKGQLQLDSTPGQGTSIELSVPISLSSLTTLLVEAGGVTSCLPFEAVRRTLRIAETDIARSPDGDTIVYDGRAIPFLTLEQVFSRAGGSANTRKHWTSVVLGNHDGLAALGIDRLIGRNDVVVRPLPPQLQHLSAVVGAAFDAEGDPIPVVSVEHLLSAARGGHWRLSAVEERPKPTILVVDDSLTTRMLEQSILESAGYRVSLAASGEEGLRLARERRYELFLVDIEMPGMNGFEFIARTRADASLRDIPCVLVSSLSSSEDRRRGLEVGARAYIVKGEFDQGGFLDTVRALAG